MGLTTLGIFHTIIGIIAIISAIISIIKFGKINLNHLTGKLYFYCTLIASLTALGLSKLGGFNFGHVLALVILVLVLEAYFFNIKKIGNNTVRYFENFFLSFSFFLSLIPTTNETLTRIPFGNPLAKAPTDPAVTNTITVLFVLFVIASVYQFIKQRKLNLKK